jgi:lysophospholipase L1-like esterase
MTAAAVSPPTSAIRTGGIPHPRRPADERLPAPQPSRAAAYQRVLHQLVRRELRLLGDLAAWAPADEAERTATLTRHADLIGRVLLHHHAVERNAVWPAVLRAVAPERAAEVRSAVEDWTRQCARIDHMLRDVATAGRQWAVAATVPARDAFTRACRSLADAVDEQTAVEEQTLLPFLGTHLHTEDWTAIAAAAHCRLSPREQLLVLGLALEDSSAGDRARLMVGLPRALRAAWHLHGRRTYRAAVVRLRGAPPAA